jgi:hypothetical protein
MAAADSPPSDSACPVCSKPIRSGSVVLFEHSELFHVHCRSRQLQLRALEQVDRAEAARERAARRLEDAHRVRAERRIQRHGLPKRARGVGVCPLCRGPAIVTDWRPGADWIAVENCPCGDFFAGAWLVEERLPSLNTVERQGLIRRIWAYRATGREAWLTTTHSTVDGPLVIRTARPDWPT